MFKKRAVKKETRRERGVEHPENEASPDESVSQTIEEKHLIRRLKRQPAGIDADKLVQGERKRVRVEDEQDDHGWSAGRGGVVDDLHKLNAADPHEKVVSSNFTGQSATIDVDKHMISYIEQEMTRRRQNAGLSTDNIHDSITDTRINDPADELYAIAQKYSRQAHADDGSITRSESMLTKIPEVDLGVEAKLRNIQETEKAKQRMKDAEKTQHRSADADVDYTQNRFMQPSLAKSRIDTTSLQPLKQQDAINDYRQGGRASDGEHYSRFRNAMSDRK